MTDYQPIECGLHSEYELAIMHAQQLRLQWVDANGLHHQGVVKPLDIFSREHEEFLLVEFDSANLELRLDRIVTVENLS